MCPDSRDMRKIEKSESSDEHIRALKYDMLKPAEFLQHWRGCAKERIDLIQSEAGLANILKKWPYYKLPWGYRLVSDN